MSDIVKFLLEIERSVGTSNDNENSTSPLLMACVGNQETVRLLLERGHDPNLWDSSLNLSPLHLASWAGETQIVRALLEAGCDKEASDRYGLQAWMFAIMQGHTHIADMLEIFTGEHAGQAGSSARLLQSAEHRSLGSATTKHTVDTAISTHSRSMTSYTVHQPHFGRVVVRHSLPVSMRQFLRHGFLHVIKRFFMGGMSMEGHFKGCTCTPMLVAVAHDALEIVEYLVSIGVPLFTEDKCSLHFKNVKVLEILAASPIWTPLVKHWFRQPKWRAQLSQNGLFSMIASAIDHSNSGTLAVLLDKVASPFPSCRIEGWLFLPSEALHQAAKFTEPSAISCAIMLLSRGLDVDHPDRNGSTPLQIAALRGHLDMVKLFLSYRATFDVAIPGRGTALAIAATEGHASVVNHLLATGAHSNFCLASTPSPVTFAAETGEYVAFRALLDAGGTATTQDYFTLIGSGHRSVLMLDKRYFHAMQGQDLLHYNCGPQALLPLLKAMPLAERALCFAALHPEEKTTALYDAATNGAVRFVDFAVRYGAAINMEGGPGGTPLMAACIAGHTSTVKHLVRCGALLTYWNGSGQVSAFVKARPHPNILRWLLVGRFTETIRLAENSSGGDMHPSATESCYDGVNEVNVELILQHDIEGYFEKHFWFIPPRRFVDIGDGCFDTVDILPSEFGKYKPTYIYF